jgi:hypothetical protein
MRGSSTSSGPCRPSRGFADHIIDDRFTVHVVPSVDTVVVHKEEKAPSWDDKAEQQQRLAVLPNAVEESDLFFFFDLLAHEVMSMEKQ